MKASIIAGGKGTRLHSLTSDLIPKALVPVAGKPIVFRQLKLIARYGIRDVAVIAGHLADLLKDKMLPEANRLGLNIEFFVEDSPLGTAGGLEYAKDFLAGEDFFVLYGDVAIEMNLSNLATFHRALKAIATIVAHPNDHPYESDILLTDENKQILEILQREKRPEGFYQNLVPAAVYCFSDKIFGYIEPSVRQDFISDIFPRIVNECGAIYAYKTPEYLRDMGTVARYEMVERDIKSNLFAKMNLSIKRPAVFFDRDGVLNREIPDKGIVTHKDLKLFTNTAKAIRLVNDTGWLAVLVTNQPQIAKGFTTLNELNIIHAKLESLLGSEHAKLDQIYFCPHHPENGFRGEIPELKIECDCRKPKAGMLKKAMQELPILLDESCMIGDSWRDMSAARAAGIYAYGVRTGIGCRDCSKDCRPDLIFSDVLEAVKFTLFGIPETKILANKITEQIQEKNETYILGVCGISRSGKSVFSHAIVRELRKQGISAMHIKLDDWILPLPTRRTGMTAEQRCQTHLYGSLLHKLLVNKKVIVTGYDHLTRDASENISYRLNGESLIILDGLFACHNTLVGKLDYSIYVETAEKTLVSRFYDFYRWKGMDDETISRLLKEREEQEWPSVKKQMKFASETIRFSESEHWYDNIIGTI